MRRALLIAIVTALPCHHAMEITKSTNVPGGAMAWVGGAPPALVKMERACGLLLVRAMGLEGDSRALAEAVQRGERRRNAKNVDFTDPEDELKFGRVVRLSRQLAILFLGHAIIEATFICKRAIQSGSPVVLTSLGSCVDELWYAYFVLAASVGFEAIAFDEGSDHDNLMSAIDKLGLMWAKFRVPMFVKSVIKVIVEPLILPVVQPHLHVAGERLRSYLASVKLLQTFIHQSV